jgi:hypothetical protein
MPSDQNVSISDAKAAALEVLLHNTRASRSGLPRTAGWGYPEPYTRDLMISALGFLASGQSELVEATRRTLEALAANQTERGHIPSLADDPEDRGASDTTPLFLFGLGLYRRSTNQPKYLDRAAQKALRWMQYQSPDDLVMVAQLPTSDWRDEQWVLGYGLYVNTIVYAYLRMYGVHDRAERLRRLMNRLNVRSSKRNRRLHEGLAVRQQPYFAMSAYKNYNSERFDLLGNSLAILTGIASDTRAKRLIGWIERECAALGRRGELAVDLPPCLIPCIEPQDPDWRTRYGQLNRPGEYHNGGVWPFICGFYVASCVAVGRFNLARRSLLALARLVKPARRAHVEWGFNEWLKAQTGSPSGCDWQTWSAAMYLYACDCVEKKETPIFDEIRSWKAGQ